MKTLDEPTEGGIVNKNVQSLLDNGVLATPDGSCGEWRIETYTISKAESDFTKMRAVIQRRDEYVPPGTYRRLVRGRTIVMSNTPMEIRTHNAFIQRATGKILINGLGLGMALTAILKKTDIESVRVIELAREVIELVGPSFRDDPRVNIIQASAFDYQPKKGERFNAVWHDIWDAICSDNLPEMHKLHRKYARRADWQGSWCRAECERLRELGW